MTRPPNPPFGAKGHVTRTTSEIVDEMHELGCLYKELAQRLVDMEAAFPGRFCRADQWDAWVWQRNAALALAAEQGIRPRGGDAK